MEQKTDIEISIAKTKEEKQEVYRLRYHIYVQEMFYTIPHADHQNKLLYGELDDWGLLMYAKIGSAIIGTSRLNIGKVHEFPREIVKLCAMDRFQKYYKNGDGLFSFASRGMIDPTYRSSQVVSQIRNEMYKLYAQYQIQFAFINSSMQLVPLQEHYGERRIGVNCLDPILGLMVSFVNLVEDVEYLQKVKSPLAKIAQELKVKQNNAVVSWFSTEFSDALNHINSQLVTQEELWNILHSRLGDAPNRMIDILMDLSEEDTKMFLHKCSVVVRCPQNECILDKNDISQALHILLSGKLYSPEKLSISKLSPEQHFGINDLLKRTRNNVNVFAKTNSEILVISYHFFAKFQRLYPDIAETIIRNLDNSQVTPQKLS